MDGRMEGLIVMKGLEEFSRPILGFEHQEFKKRFAKRPHAFQFDLDTLSEWMDGLLSNNLEVNLLIKCKNK
jgi:hypothetical protein